MRCTACVWHREHQVGFWQAVAERGQPTCLVGRSRLLKGMHTVTLFGGGQQPGGGVHYHSHVVSAVCCQWALRSDCRACLASSVNWACCPTAVESGVLFPTQSALSKSLRLLNSTEQHMAFCLAFCRPFCFKQRLACSCCVQPTWQDAYS